MSNEKEEQLKLICPLCKQETLVSQNVPFIAKSKILFIFACGNPTCNKVIVTIMK